MKFVKKMILVLPLLLWVCLSIAPIAHGWSTFEQLERIRYNNLSRKVHADHWTIGYVYDKECLPEEMNNNKALEEAMTKAIQAWLQPIRDLNTGKPVVNDFRYEHKDKIWGEDALKPFDLVVIFFCDFANSHIDMRGKPLPPSIKSAASAASVAIRDSDEE